MKPGEVFIVSHLVDGQYRQVCETTAERIVSNERAVQGVQYRHKKTYAQMTRDEILIKMIYEED